MERTCMTIRNTEAWTIRRSKPILCSEVKLGVAAERLAAIFLAGRGVSVLRMNYYSNRGEIDIIAEADDDLLFVEVKSRSSLKYGYPHQAVGRRKARRLAFTAKCFLLGREDFWRNYRFDIIEIYWQSGHLCWIKDITMEGGGDVR